MSMDLRELVVAAYERWDSFFAAMGSNSASARPPSIDGSPTRAA